MAAIPPLTPERILPAWHWLSRYRRQDLPGDLMASVIVTIMLIPQGLAYALLAGLPPQIGLYASAAPLLGYALFGSSRVLAVGPVAVLSLMTAAAASRVAAPGTAEYVGAALILALASGAMLFAMGLARLGFLANLLSHSVIAGFIGGSALLIAASQLKHILALPVSSGAFLGVLRQVGAMLPQANAAASIIGIVSILLLIGIRLWLAALLRRIGLSPSAADLVAKAGPVLAVLAATVIVAAFRLDETADVPIVGAIPSGLPPISLPPGDAGLWLALLPSAFALSVVGFVESVSVAQSLGAKRRQRIDPDRELLGLGAANLAAAFTGGYPVTGGLARSVVNFAAGANTALAGVLTAGLIAVAVLLLPPLFYYLPNSVLAATIIVAVLGMIDLGEIRRTWRYNRADGLASVATAAAVLAVGVEAGILIGVGLSIALHIWRTSRPHMAIVGRVPGTEHYRNVERHRVATVPNVLAVRVDESLYFANARFLEDRIAELIAERPEIRHVLLICSAVNFIDASALENLMELIRRLADAGVSLHLAEVKGPVMDRLQRTDFLSRLTGRVFLSTHAGMTALAGAH